MPIYTIETPGSDRKIPNFGYGVHPKDFAEEMVSLDTEISHGSRGIEQV
ncbi:hypothetical protein [Porphyromonas sp.]|nr:hypothetical protein [Porphyromonas sp.]MDO4771909.1 hypothetical protein [Porphyromonas sp.]